MPGEATRRYSGPRAGGRAEGDVSLLGLLRQTHIFASTVREVLEVKLLREVTTAPLTLPQLQLLKLMVRDGQHQLTQVARFLGVSPPAATKNIDKLVGLGLARRERSTGDRRATLLSASPEGRRLVEDYERGLLVQALEASSGVKKRAAKLLGVSFRSFRYRLEKLGVENLDSKER
jgi:DNA-binding MarR family transcriptional regulator